MLSCRQCTKLAAVCFTAYRIEPCIFPAYSRIFICAIPNQLTQSNIVALHILAIYNFISLWIVACCAASTRKQTPSLHILSSHWCAEHGATTAGEEKTNIVAVNHVLWTLYIYTQTYLDDVHLVVHHPCFSVLIFISGIKATLLFSSSGIRDFS